MTKQMKRRSITTLDDFIKIYNTAMQLGRVTKHSLMLSVEKLDGVAKEYGLSSGSIKQYVTIFRRTWNIKDDKSLTEDRVVSITGFDINSEFTLKAIGAIYVNKKVSAHPTKASRTEYLLNKKIGSVKADLANLTDQKDIVDVLDTYLKEEFTSNKMRLDFLKSHSIDDIKTKLDKFYTELLFSMLDTGSDNPKVEPVADESVSAEPAKEEVESTEEKDGFDLGYAMIKTSVNNMEDILYWAKEICGIESIEELEHAIATYKKAIKIKADFEAMTLSLNE